MLIMVPPINLKEIRRNTDIRDKARRLYLLSEGTLTEPRVLNAILNKSTYLLSNNAIRFYEVERTDQDFGVNSLKGMIDIAYKNVINNRDIFSKKRDKVIIFFDLDIYHEDYNEIKKIINDNKKYIIFVFTNPAIELFLLLCKDGSYENIIQPNINDILRNERIAGTNRRYIHQLVVDTFGVDPKNNKEDFIVFSNGLLTAINQEKLFISQKLSNPDNNLISNFGYIFEHIKNNDFDSIDYFTVL